MEVKEPGVIRVGTSIVLDLIVSLDKCPRCLGSHPELAAHQLRSPSPPHWDLWATCPLTQEPIMFNHGEEGKKLLQTVGALVDKVMPKLQEFMNQESETAELEKLYQAAKEKVEAARGRSKE